MDVHTLQERQLDALREVANIGAGHAATALSQMTGARIDVAVPHLQVTPLSDLPEMLGDAGGEIAAVLIHVLGDLTGRTILVLPLDSARRLAEILLSQAAGTIDQFDELGRSALMEAGNILSAAHMNALSDFLGMMLLPSVPHLSIDKIAVVMDAVLNERSVGDLAISIETRFALRGSDPVSGQFLFLPDLASLRIIFDALRLE